MQVQNFEESSDISAIADNRMTSGFTSESMKELLRLTSRCVNPMSEQRPSMSLVEAEIHRIHEQEISLTTVMTGHTPIVTLGSQLFRTSRWRTECLASCSKTSSHIRAVDSPCSLPKDFSCLHSESWVSCIPSVQKRNSWEAYPSFGFSYPGVFFLFFLFLKRFYSLFFLFSEKILRRNGISCLLDTPITRLCGWCQTRSSKCLVNQSCFCFLKTLEKTWRNHAGSRSNSCSLFCRACSARRLTYMHYVRR